MKLILAATAAVFAVGSISATAHAGAAVQPIEAWGRYVTSLDLKYKMVGKKMDWVPKGNFLFQVKGAESDDVILAQYYLGKKKWGKELKCPVQVQPMKGSDYAFVSTYNCAPNLDKNGITKAAKAVKVVLGYRQLAEGKDYRDLATYSFAVVAHKGPSGDTEFHINKDFRMGEAWLHLKQNGRSWNIFSWFKTGNDRESSLYSNGFKIRCSMGDKKLNMDTTTNSRYDYGYDDYAAKSSDDRKTQWSMYYFFPDGNGQAFFKDNPGKYRCVLTRGGELDREFYFEIGADGKPVKPACQQGDNPLVRAPASTTLIKTVFKTPQDRKFDAKAFAKGAFYGRKDVPKACGF